MLPVVFDKSKSSTTMKTAVEIVSYLADRIGSIYFHAKPLMFAANAAELDRVLWLYHEIWSEIVDRSDLGLQVENSLGFAIPYSRQHPEATEEQIAREVVRRWSVVSRNMGALIPYEALSQKFQESRPLPSVLMMLLGAASRLQDNDMLRLQVPAPLFLFLHCLARHCDRSAKPLGKFLARISASQLADEIVRDLLPAEFSEVRSELERLQAEKEAAVANAEFQHAAALRDQTDLLKRRVQQACPNAIDIQPDHFVQAIARLGYDQPITI